MINDIVASGLIEPETLSDLLKSGSSPKVLDSSYGGMAYETYLQERIDDAQFFDIDAVAAPDAPLAHTLPPAELFGQAVGQLGVSNDDLVVVYDQGGIAMAASRAWWMFRVFGHDKVCVLNGGLPAWAQAGLPLTSTPPVKPDPAHFTTHFRQELFRSMEDVEREIDADDALILDARSTERFSGSMGESRPDLRSGHIPGSHNQPFMELIDPAKGKLKDKTEIEALLGRFPDASFITASCGSGVTACVIALAFYHIGRKDVAIYDGSWTEWGATDAQTPVAISS